MKHMIKGKLLRDLPLAKAGKDVFMEDGVVTFMNSEGYTEEKIIGYVDPEDFSEWIEEIKEIKEKPKTVWDLNGGEYVYTIDFRDLSVQHTVFAGGGLDNNLIKLGLMFLTEQEAKNAIIRMETANRKDKFMPETLKNYYVFDSKSEEIQKEFNIGYSIDISFISQGLAFRTESECREYMTDEVKRAFGYIS